MKHDSRADEELKTDMPEIRGDQGRRGVDRSAMCGDMISALSPHLTISAGQR